MSFFKKTAELESKFGDFVSILNTTEETLYPFLSEQDILSISNIKKSFVDKTEDFFREDRKLHIGIVGQVKAGKSSFLNTLLFDGQEVLPTASTPKTATLTKIEYAKENALAIEYYQKEEWAVLERNAQENSETQQVKVAKEIMAMVQQNGVDPWEYIQKGEEVISFASYEELLGKLNHYVGENGKCTPFVKSVVLSMDNEKLKGISIVDTPGMNDPIVSRTARTREFMELCDVVFFLSRSSLFIDSADVELLTMQLPQKGVKRLILVSSKFDDVLLDVIYDCDDIGSAIKMARKSLKNHAVKSFEKVLEQLKLRGASDNILGVVSECKKPVFVSAMTHNMSKKVQEEYTHQEKAVYQGFSSVVELSQDELKEIGNMEQVIHIFEEVVEKKEETLLEKSNLFIPNAKVEIKNMLTSILDRNKQQLKILQSVDKMKLLETKQEIDSKMNHIHSALETLFGEVSNTLEKNKAEAVKELRDNANENGVLTDKQGQEAHTGTRTVSTSKWYNPFSWGSSRTYEYTYYTYYNYLEASEALENLRRYANEASNRVEDVFNHAVDIAMFKRKLLKVVSENMDLSSENIDPNYIKIIVEQQINEIEFPLINIDVSSYLNGISGKFSGEIKDENDKEALKAVLAESIMKLFDVICDKLINSLVNFKKCISDIKHSFGGNLTEKINQEFNEILEQMEHKEKEIDKLTHGIGVLEDELKQY